jgi:hypothetical protein
MVFITFKLRGTFRHGQCHSSPSLAEALLMLAETENLGSETLGSFHQHTSKQVSPQCIQSKTIQLTVPMVPKTKQWQSPVEWDYTEVSANLSVCSWCDNQNSRNSQHLNRPWHVHHSWISRWNNIPEARTRVISTHEPRLRMLKPVHLHFRMFHQTCILTSSPYSTHMYMPPSPDKRRERLLHSIHWESCRCFIPHHYEKRESISLHHLNSWNSQNLHFWYESNVYAWVKRAL